MAYNLQIQKLLIKKDTLKSPQDKIKILKEALAIADSKNDIDWGYDLRLDIMDEEYYTPCFDERFKAFAWLLDACDKNPDLFNEDDLLWRYRWMVVASSLTPDITADQIENINKDFKERLIRNGYGLRAFYDDEYRRYLNQNKMNKAKEYLDLRNNEKVNDMICPACEAADQIDYFLRIDDTKSALTVYNDMVANKYECMRKPFDVYCSFINYYTNKGEFEKAYEMFLKAEEKLHELEEDTSPISNISVLIYFLANYDKEKAWQYFEKYIHWSIDAIGERSFKTAINVLPLLSEGGNRKLTINPTMQWYKSDGNYNLDELYNIYHNLALDLAKRFDKRNGTDYYIQQLNEKIK